jgi:hypothetical protein
VILETGTHLMPAWPPIVYVAGMKKPRPSQEPKNRRPLEDQSQDAARLAAVKSRPAWETRQPAQITKADVEEARANPDKVKPPGKMGESQGAAS